MPDNQGTQPSTRIRHVLAGFDGSEESKHAIDVAVDICRGLGAQLTLVSVLPDTAHLETTEARAAAERSARSELDSYFETWRRRFTGTDTSIEGLIVLVGGDPADRLNEYAREHGFDLVVVGSHGRDQATHGGAARVLSAILRSPNCPVLVVPAAAT